MPRETTKGSEMHVFKIEIKMSDEEYATLVENVELRNRHYADDNGAVESPVDYMESIIVTALEEAEKTLPALDEWTSRLTCRELRIEEETE